MHELDAHDTRASERVATILVERALRDEDRYVRSSSVFALGRLSPSSLRCQRQALQELFGDPKKDTRLAALEVLGKMSAEDVADLGPMLAQLANGDEDTLVRYQAKSLLAKPQVEGAVSDRLALLNASQRAGVQGIASRRGLFLPSQRSGGAAAASDQRRPPKIMEFESPTLQVSATGSRLSLVDEGKLPTLTEEV